MDTQYNRAIAYARELGAQHGRNAAAWYTQDTIGGRASGDVKAAARAILKGIEDGDPAITDSFPSADLSGQWADTLTSSELVTDALADADYEDASGRCPHDDGFTCPDWCGEICDQYEWEYAEHAQLAIEDAARAVLDAPMP